MLESVYEAVLSSSLGRRGLQVDRQVPIEVRYDGLTFAEGFRADLLIERRLIVEINFGGATFRENARRIVNNHPDFASSRPRVHQSAVNDVTARRGE